MRRTRCATWRHLAVIAVAALSLFQVAPSIAATGSVVYTYDTLGRLSTASYDTGVCMVYSYDSAGNRTAQTIRVSGSGSTGVWGCFNWGQALWGS